MRTLQIVIGLHCIAVVTSAAHGLIDSMLLLAMAPLGAALYVAIGVAVYRIWIRSLKDLAARGYGGAGAALMALVWAALVNSGTIAFCPPAVCWPSAYLFHIAIIIAGLGAAAATLPVLRRRVRDVQGREAEAET